MSVIIAYLAAVLGFNMSPDKTVQIVADLLKKVDGEKIAVGLKELFSSPAWQELAKAGTDVVKEFMKAW